ncbi:transposase [Pirellulaceae bacterium SH449]
MQPVLPINYCRTPILGTRQYRYEPCSYEKTVYNSCGDRNWNVFIERPPKPDVPAERMFKYLARYMTGGPISDLRILGEKAGRIWFLARSLRKGEGQIATSLERVEFVRSWREVILKNDHPVWYKPTDVECEFPPEPKPSWEHAYGSQTKKASEEPDLFDEIIAMRESLAESNTA